LIDRSARRRLAAVGGGALVVVAAMITYVLARQPPDPRSRGGSFDVAAYRGLGTWVDAYDYVPQYQAAGVAPAVDLASIDAMAAAGVQTVFVQAARNDSKTPTGLIDADLLTKFLRRAHQKKLRVVGWSTPEMRDVAFDLDRLLKIQRFVGGGERFDGIAVDIEDNQTVADPALRSRNLVELTKELRTAVGPNVAIGGIVPPNVQLDVINPLYWPGFPWRSISPYYDVWLPMAYWSERQVESGYHDPHRYAVESVQRLRVALGDPQARVHLIGGIADKITVSEIPAFLLAVKDTGAIGASTYDFATSSKEQLAALHDGLPAVLPATTVPASTLVTTAISTSTTTTEPAPASVP
jgi:hypothetical protein